MYTLYIRSVWHLSKSTDCLFTYKATRTINEHKRRHAYQRMEGSNHMVYETNQTDVHRKINAHQLFATRLWVCSISFLVFHFTALDSLMFVHVLYKFVCGCFDVVELVMLMYHIHSCGRKKRKGKNSARMNKTCNEDVECHFQDCIRMLSATFFIQFCFFSSFEHGRWSSSIAISSNVINWVLSTLFLVLFLLSLYAWFLPRWA